MDKPITDEMRFAYMARERIALVPEKEGGWSADVYGDAGSMQWSFAGDSPRAALDSAINELFRKDSQ